MSFFDVRIPDLKMTVLSADGQPVQPVPVDEFRIGAAETYDVIVEPMQEHYQIQAESIDRAGFAIASLQNEMFPKQQKLEMPKARPRALLTMDDMGHGQMDTGKMDHGSHQQMNMQHHAHDQMQMSASAMSEHSQHQTMASFEKRSA